MAEKTTTPTVDERLATLTDAVAKLAQVAASQASQPTSVADLTKVMAAGVADANMKARQWWDELAFPDKSALNPKGEKDHPRPPLRRDVWWVGFHLSANELTREEIELLNLLSPGRYPLVDDMGTVVRRDFFEIIPRDKNYPDGDIHVSFPCKEEQDRLLLARMDRGRGMVDILKQMLPREAPASV